MTDSTKIDQALSELREVVKGLVLTPADDQYRAEVSGFDLAQSHIAPIAVSAIDSADVSATVRIAAASGLPITVLGGGHGDIPTVTEGILLTVRRINTVELDASEQTARVGVGATWHDVLAVAAPAGLARCAGRHRPSGWVGTCSVEGWDQSAAPSGSAVITCSRSRSSAQTVISEW